MAVKNYLFNSHRTWPENIKPFYYSLYCLIHTVDEVLKSKLRDSGVDRFVFSHNSADEIRSDCPVIYSSTLGGYYHINKQKKYPGSQPFPS